MTLGAAALALGLIASAGQAAGDSLRLDTGQTRAFRAWFLAIVADQVSRGPNPRWVHRDCAGLVRFAVGEALRDHDGKWRRANGFVERPTPPDVVLREAQRPMRNSWRRAGGGQGAFVSALQLVQENSEFVSRDVNEAAPGDLLFFDQGEEQHVMIWMGESLAYHTGTVTPADTGLRRISFQELMRWRDTRWLPDAANPNFIGFFRFSFLAR